MNQIAASTPSAVDTARPVEQAFFLSEILRARIVVRGKRVGKLEDLIIKENGLLPVVTQLFIALPFGETAVVPWEKVTELSPKEITLEVDEIRAYKGEPDEGAVRLEDHILDKKAIDMEGREMEVVYDVRLVLRNKRLYVSEVDLSHYGLLRRIGLKGVADWLYRVAESVREQTIPWTYIQPLPRQLGRFRGDLRFNLLKEKLADMHPVDLADILEEMDPEQRIEVFSSLDTETASDTLEEIDPNVQRDLVESLDAQKVAELIDEMTTAQAADVLSVLSKDETSDIIPLLDPTNADKIRAIMDEQEASILNYATQEYLAFPPDCTAEQAQDQYRTAARGKDVVMYLYILDEEHRLQGVLDIKELLLAEDQALLKDVMVKNAISMKPDSTLKEAAEMFVRYQFRALPIADDDDHMLGVVTYRDVVGLKHRFVE